MTELEKSSESSSTSITLHLPFPISVNRIWRGKVKGAYLSEEYKAWKLESGGEWLKQRSRLPVRSIKGPYHLLIMVMRPDKKRRDLGNLEKVVSDFLQDMGIIEDDCLAESITMEWRANLPSPTVVVVSKMRGATTEAIAPL